MIRGTKIELAKPPTKRFDVGASIHNRFDIEVIDAVSGKIKQKATAENVICSGLWARLLAGNTYNVGIHYGGGSGTPAAGDTSLFSFIGYVASSTHDIKYDYDTNVYAVTKKAIIAETVAVGQAITEVGIAYSSTETSLVTHAMLQDMNGNPVSLLKTDTDIFNIYTTVFVHLSMPAGVRYLGTTRIESSYYMGYLAHVAGLCATPEGYGFVAGGYCAYLSTISVKASRDVANRTLTLAHARLDASAQNSRRGIKTLFLGTQALPNYVAPSLDFSFEIDEGSIWYPKTEIKDESIGTGDGTTKDFSTKMNFAKNISVRVDGVPVDATVEFGCGRNIGHYLRLIRLPSSGFYLSGGYQQTPCLPMHTADDSDIHVCYNVQGDVNLKPVYENILHETHGIASISGSSKYIAVSDDLTNWIELGDITAIPEQYQHYRYWILHHTTSSIRDYAWTFTPTSPVPASVNVHLVEAPPEGAVITADYDAICVGKDENHVFDFSVTFKFNEYSDQ